MKFMLGVGGKIIECYWTYDMMLNVIGHMIRYDGNHKN